jgi:heptosyltransferase-3
LVQRLLKKNLIPTTTKNDANKTKHRQMHNQTEKNAEEVKQILFITLSCVGDAIMTTPVLEALHLIHPHASIDIVADKRSSTLFAQCPYRGDIIHKDKQKLFRGGLDLVRKLRRKPYDIIVDLRTDGVAYLLRGKKRYTKWRKHSYGAHAVEKLMGAIRDIQGDTPIPPTVVWRNESNREFADQALSVLPRGLWLALAPGVNARHKRWANINYTRLANSLQDVISGVIFVGSEEESEYAQKVSTGLSLPFIDLCGADLLDTAAVLDRAKVFVGSDSGLGHLASAVGTATVSLFSKDFPERCLPWGPSASWIKGEGDVVSNIEVEQVETKAQQALSA